MVSNRELPDHVQNAKPKCDSGAAPSVLTSRTEVNVACFRSVFKAGNDQVPALAPSELIHMGVNCSDKTPPSHSSSMSSKKNFIVLFSIVIDSKK